MFFRYYQNWLYESYDYSGNKKQRNETLKRPKSKQILFRITLKLIDFLLKTFSQKGKKRFRLILKLSDAANPLMKKYLPKIESVNSILTKLLEPINNSLSEKVIDFVYRADPAIFEEIRPSQEVINS